MADAADPTGPDLAEEATDSGVSYGFRPSLFGAGRDFRLTADALQWQAGRRKGRVPYGEISRVRLSFRPLGMQSARFLMEIWAPGTPRLQVASTSWKSMVEQERLDDAYARFVRDLHRRLAQAGAAPRLETGYGAFLYWPGVAVFVVAGLALGLLIVRALQEAAYAGALFVAGFLGVFAWQIGNFLRRNRPSRYRCDALPELLLPRTTSTEQVA